MDRVERVKKPLTVRLAVRSEGQQEIMLESTLADEQGPDWGHMAVLVAQDLVGTLRHMTVPTFQGEGSVPHAWKKESENVVACTRCGVWLSGYTEMTPCPVR